MSIATEITRIKNNIANAYTSLKNKKATIPENMNSENLSKCIDSISNSTSTYTRPVDWLAIPEHDETKDEIFILFGVFNVDINTLQLKLKCNSGKSVTINWGDGNTEVFTSTDLTLLKHFYNYSDVSEDSYTEHNGCRQVLVKIVGERGSLYEFNTQVQYTITDPLNNEVYISDKVGTNVFEIDGNVESSYCYMGTPVNNLGFHKLMEIFSFNGINALQSSLEYFFYNCSSLQLINDLDTSNVTSMTSMFNGCNSLQTIPQLDTSNVKNMGSMFNSCNSLQTIPQLDTSNVTYMSYTFSGCNSLQAIPQLDTSNVTYMSYMFNGCNSLQTIPQLDTSNVTNISYMFNGCNLLRTIPQLDTSNVTNMNSMFSNCYSLQKIKILNAGYRSGTGTSSLTISDLTNSTLMSVQALVDLIDGLADVSERTGTCTLQLGTKLKSYLTDEQIGVATNKGWVIS